MKFFLIVHRDFKMWISRLFNLKAKVNELQVSVKSEEF